MRDVWIRGAAMTPFGRHSERSARDLVEEALAGALRDSGLEPHDLQAAYVGNAVAGLMNGQESMRAQVVLRRTGLMGVPMVHVENADASGSTALHIGWQAVAHGAYDCVVVIGYEKLDHSDRARSYRAINSGMDLTELADIFGPDAGQERSVFLQLSGASSPGGDGDRYTTEAMALISVKNHHNGSLNPCAHYRDPVTAEQVLASRPVAGRLTRLMCAPLSDGAACLVLCSSDFRRARSGGARIAASVQLSGRGDDLRMPPSLRRAAQDAYTMASLGPEDLDLAELHDMTSITEMHIYGEIGLCPRDEVSRLAEERATWLGGRLPVNASGGLLARGHAPGATGAAQVVELAWQLQGRCGDRQVPSARVGMAENAGGWVGSDIGTTCVHIVTR